MPITMQIPDVIYGSGDDVFTCPFDGSRTIPMQDNGLIYIEKCLQCGKVLAFDSNYDDEADRD